MNLYEMSPRLRVHSVRVAGGLTGGGNDNVVEIMSGRGVVIRRDMTMLMIMWDDTLAFFYVKCVICASKYGKYFALAIYSSICN